MPIIGHLGAAALGIYKHIIEKSVRIRRSASAYLAYTPSTTQTNPLKWTISLWVKRGVLGTGQTLFSGDNGGGTSQACYFDANDQLRYDTAAVVHRTSPMVFRDPTAYYHIAVVVDVTLATGNDRLKLYVNGVRQTWTTGTEVTQNVSLQFMRQGVFSAIGASAGSASGFFDGNIAEVVFVDGQALDASYFGEAVNGTWIPKKYAGTYGTNGFYLDFKTGTNLSTLTQDKSGNGNNWTASNVSLTAGATYDWSNDSPTSNYCTANPLDVLSTTATSSDGALQSTSGAGGYLGKRGTFVMSSGKWYWEVTPTAGTEWYIGVSRVESTADGILGNTTGGQQTGYAYGYSGQKLNGTFASYGATYTVNDVIGIALNLDAGTIEFYKNGVSQGVAFASGVSGNFFPAFSDGSGAASSSIVYNFGQRPFAYTPPSGFKSLSTANLPEPGVAASEPYKHFGIKLHTGNNSSQNISGVVFAPDFVWIKARNSAQNHALFDRNRGVQQLLTSNATDAEVTASTSLTAFNSDGITVAGDNRTGSNTITYVDWMWKAGGAAVANNAGSISSQVSANPTAGFSIITYTGTGANATVGHGLGVAPKMVIVKPRAATTTSDNWCVGHSSLTSGFESFLVLNGTDAQVTAANRWNSTNPTSSVFSVGAVLSDNTKPFVAYCFAEIPGYSKIGSYTGNGSADGPFVYCEFRPRYVLIKRVDATGHWRVVDTSRSTYNANCLDLYPNLTNAEGAVAFDFLSNGIKPRVTDPDYNASGGSYIFMAFAEAPFKYANAR